MWDNMTPGLCMLFAIMFTTCSICVTSCMPVGDNNTEMLLYSPNTTDANLTVTTEQQPAIDVNFSGRLTNHTYNEPIATGLHYRGYKFHYDITFMDDDCCPLLHVYNEKSRYLDNGCLYDKYLSNEFTFNPLLVELKPGEGGCVPFTTSYFYENTNKTQQTKVYKTGYRCQGDRQMLISEPKFWNVSFGLACSKMATGQKINLDYNITFTEIQESAPHYLNHPTCKKFLDYDMYVVPNILGLTSAIKIRDTVNLMLLAVEAASCYKNLHVMSCSAMFPTVSPQGRVYQPCRQMCEEMIRGGLDVFEALGIYMTCSFLVNSTDPEQCYYLPADCDEPVAPPNGYLSHTTNYNGTTFAPEQVFSAGCDEGYQPNPQLTTVECSWMGEWSPSFSCEQINSNNKTPIKDSTLVISIVSALLILILAMFIVIFLVKKNKRGYVFVNNEFHIPDILMNEPDNYRYDIFLSYCDTDMYFVYRGENCLRRKLEAKRYLVCLHGRDFLPGNAIEMNIIGATEQSKVVVCLLSKKYLESEWCRLEFDLFRVLLNHKFKFIVILLEGEEILNQQAGGSLWGYVQRYVYLSALDPHFDDKLFHALPPPTCADIQGIEEVGGVHPVMTDHIIPI